MKNNLDKIEGYRGDMDSGRVAGERLEWLQSEVERLTRWNEDWKRKAAALRKEASKPMKSDRERVEVIMLVTDKDRDWAERSIAGIFRTTYPFKLTVYENSCNTRNTSRIWNKLVGESTCGYVCLIDSDAVPANDFITPMVNLLKETKDAVAVGPIAGGKNVTTCQSIGLGSKNEPFEANGHISGYCFMFRKSFWKKHRFDEDFYFYGQESDWIERILEKKLGKVMVQPNSHVRHGDDTGPSIAVRREEYDTSLDAELSQKLFNDKKDERKKK